MTRAELKTIAAKYNMDFIRHTSPTRARAYTSILM